MVYNRLVRIKAEKLMDDEMFLKICTVYVTFGMIKIDEYQELIAITEEV